MRPDLPLVLGFDTSAAHCAAALLSGAQVVASVEEPMAKGQAERLMGLLDEVLAAGGATWSDLTALGVGIGPGNFTGIRISVAAARGLALALNIPAVGVSSLEAAALGSEGPVVAVVDARGGTVYAQAFPHDPHPRVTTLDLLEGGLPRLGWATGVRAPGSPIAVAIAQIAAHRARPDLPPPAPLYLREPDAAPSRDLPPMLLP